MLTNHLTNETKSWAEFMVDVAIAYVGIGDDLQQGQLENAQQNFHGLSTLSDTLREEGCTQCHATKRYCFVDQTVLVSISRLTILRKKPLGLSPQILVWLLSAFNGLVNDSPQSLSNRLTDCPVFHSYHS